MSDRRHPDGLGAAGEAVWNRILADLGDEWELDGRELVTLEAACKQADLNARLEEALEHDGVVVAGSAGQSRMNAIATELRQGRLALERLLGALALPGEDGAARTSAGKRAEAAAQSRWQRGGRRGAA